MRSTSLFRIGHILPVLVIVALLAPAVAPPPESSFAVAEAPRLMSNGSPFGINSHLATRYWDPASMSIPADVVARLGSVGRAKIFTGFAFSQHPMRPTTGRTPMKRYAHSAGAA